MSSEISSTNMYSQLLSSMTTATESLTTASSEEDTDSTQAIYAEEGDSKYDEDMDEDGDGVVTYEEYTAYLTENLGKAANVDTTAAKTTVSKTTDENGNEVVEPVNAAKAIAAYTDEEATSFISTES